ncbi:MAG: hypothetical protein FJ276_32795, partial [Planctomycetes bacterium]|nr:hypothetical protein [Planctomycetota bacterium]
MSQAARIVSTRLREELGGITEAEQRAARIISFRTTVLALAIEPGMICSMTHADMPGGTGEFRIIGWRLNGDYSIEVWGRSTTDSMYDLTGGPKPADVTPDPLPAEDFTIPDVTVFKAGQQQEDGSFLSVMAWDVLRPDWLKFDWAALAPADRTNWTGIGIWIELPDGSQHDHTGWIPFADFARIPGDKFTATGSVAIEPTSIPSPPENWKIICVSYGVDGQPKRDSEGKVTGKSVTLATLTKWGVLTDLAATVAEYGWDETTEPSKPVARIDITYTNPQHADEGTTFTFWTHRTSTAVTEPPDAGKFAHEASKGWESGVSSLDIWIDRPPVGEPTERIWIRAAVWGRYYSGKPLNDSPVCYVDVTAPGAPAQVTGFSLTRNDLTSPAKLFTVSINYTRPVSLEFWYALVERIACDSDYNPLPGAKWEHFMEVGAYATPGTPTSELAVRDGHVYPTAAAEYWKGRARSVSRAGIFNDTAPPTANLSIPTVTTIEGSKVVDIPTASFASGIRPVLLVASLPALPDALYPAGTVAYHTGEVRLYKVNSAGNAWVYAVDGGKDIVADSITAGQVAAGAIRTQELYAGEILVGRGGGKPSRFRVNDSFGNMAAFLGTDDADTYLNWFRDIRIGPNIAAPVIVGDGSGLSITDAAISITGPNGVITLSPVIGSRIVNSDNRLFMLGGAVVADLVSAPTKNTTLAYNYVNCQSGANQYSLMWVDPSGGLVEVATGGAVKAGLYSYGTYGPYINVAGYYAVSGVTVIGSTRVGYLTELYVDGSGSPASRVALTGGSGGGVVAVTDTAYATRAK